MKLFSKIILLFFAAVPIFSQASYHIDDFGIYIITEEGILKVPGDYRNRSEPDFLCFIDNFAVFIGPRGHSGMFFIYDMERHIISEWLGSYPHSYLPRRIEKYPGEVVVYTKNTMYALDSQTLSLKESWDVGNPGSFTLSEGTGGNAYYQRQHINENTTRYYFGGGHSRYNNYHDPDFHPDLKGVPWILEDGDTPFSSDCRYVDLEFDYDKFREESRFFRAEEISFDAEAGGERAVVIVYYWVYAR